MKSLKYFLLEGSGEILNTKKGKWIKFDPKKLSPEERDELAKEFIELISTAYAPIGGHVKFKSVDDVFADKEIEFWQAVDLHGDPDVDLIVFGKDSKHGIKFTGVGHDGEKDSKKIYLDSKAKDLSKPGFYNEVSGKIAEIMMGKYNVPSVDTQEKVEKVLGKKIEWHGKHPDGVTPGDGWYTRKIAGHPHTKILLGKPKGV